MDIKSKEIRVSRIKKINSILNKIENRLDTFQEAYKLNKLEFYIHPQSIHFVGAETGGGKTSFLIALSKELIKQGKRVIYLNLEESIEDIYFRFYAERMRRIEEFKNLKFWMYGSVFKEKIEERRKFIDWIEEKRKSLIVDEVSSYKNVRREIVDNIIEFYEESLDKNIILIIDYYQLLGTTREELMEADKMIISIKNKYKITPIISFQPSFSSLTEDKGKKSSFKYNIGENKVSIRNVGTKIDLIKMTSEENEELFKVIISKSRFSEEKESYIKFDKNNFTYTNKN